MSAPFTPPTTGEDITFWAQIVLANVWAASADGGWLPILFLLIALAIRAPYWVRLWQRK